MKQYMEEVTMPDLERAGRTETICWDCGKACRGGCSWSDPLSMKPVEDWVATKNGSGYVVHACPEFERETYCYGRYRTADDYILALEIAVTDRKHQIAVLKKRPSAYRKLIENQQKQIEKLTMLNTQMQQKIYELEGKESEE